MESKRTLELALSLPGPTTGMEACLLNDEEFALPGPATGIEACLLNNEVFPLPGSTTGIEAWMRIPGGVPVLSQVPLLLRPHYYYCHKATEDNMMRDI